MDQPTSTTYATARGLTAWTDAITADQSKMLLRASDYITANYRLKTTFTAGEQAIYDQAQFMIAYDTLTNTTPLQVRFSGRVLKESVDLGGVKSATDYADVPLDPYPQVTTLLTPLRVSLFPSYYTGTLVR